MTFKKGCIFKNILQCHSCFIHTYQVVVIFFEVPGKVFWICHSFPLHKSISQSACSSSFTPLKAEVRRWWWNLGRLSLKIAASYSKWPGNDDVSSWDAKCAWKEEECAKSLEKIALFSLDAKIAKKKVTSLLFSILPKEKRTFLFGFMELFGLWGYLQGVGGLLMTRRGKIFTT